MPCLLGLAALIIPRIVILVLYFLTDFFGGVFDSVLWPLLGFIFAPTVLLWYAFVQVSYAGQWGTVPLIGMIVAVLIDFGGLGSTRKR